jgi:MFS family permease
MSDEPHRQNNQEGSESPWGQRLRDMAGSVGANRAILALTLGRMGDGIGNSVLFIVVPLYVATLPAPNVPFSQVVRTGILLSWFGLINGVGQPFAGALIDRVGRRKPFVVGGLLLLAAGSISYLFVNQYWQMLLSRTAQGLGAAFTIPATLALMADASQRGTRGGSMGIFTTGRVLALGIGPLIGGALNDAYGFNSVFYTSAGFVLLGALLVQFWVKDIRISVDKIELPSFSSQLSAPILALGFATFAMATAFTMITSLEKQFNARLHGTALSFGLAFSVLMFSRVLLQIPVGRWSDRGRRRPFVIAGLLLMAASTAPLGYVTQQWQLILLRILQGVASAGIAAPVFALAADMTQTGEEGRHMSIVTMGFGFGIALGTLIGGVGYGVSFQFPFLLGGGLAALGAVLIVWLVPSSVERELKEG